MLALAESKGINVGRVFNTLGFADYRCISVVGGGIGRIIRDSVAREGINSLYYEIDGDSRVNTALVYEGRKEVLVINEPGPIMTEEEVEGFLLFCRGAIDAPGALVVSGSAPRGFAPRHLLRVVDAAAAAGIPVKADIAGVWLSSLLERPLDLLKLNEDEFFLAFGIKADDRDRVLDFKLRHGIRVLMITEGARGCTAFSADGACYKASLSNVETNIAVGSGDSFFAGFLYGEAMKYSFEDSLHLANACGYANTSRYGAGVFDCEDIKKARESVRVERVG